MNDPNNSDQPTPKPQSPLAGGLRKIEPSTGFKEELEQITATEPAITPLLPVLDGQLPNSSPATNNSANNNEVASPAISTKDEESQLYPTLPSSAGTLGSAPISRSPFGKQEKLINFSLIPKGIIVIVAVSVLSTIYKFLTLSSDTTISQNNGAILVGSIIAIVLALGLLLFNNICRILLITFSAFTIFGSFLGFFQVIDIQQNTNTGRTKVQQDIADLKQKTRLTIKEEANLENYKQKLQQYDSISGATFMTYYISYIGNMAYAAFVLIYLLRPSIKSQFDH